MKDLIDYMIRMAKLKFDTTLLGVIDETSKKILAEMGCNPDSIRIAGNLHLENLTKKEEQFDSTQTKFGSNHFSTRYF